MCCSSLGKNYNTQRHYKLKFIWCRNISPMSFSLKTNFKVRQKQWQDFSKRVQPRNGATITIHFKIRFYIWWNFVLSEFSLKATTVHFPQLTALRKYHDWPVVSKHSFIFMLISKTLLYLWKMSDTNAICKIITVNELNHVQPKHKGTRVPQLMEEGHRKRQHGNGKVEVRVGEGRGIRCHVP